MKNMSMSTKDRVTLCGVSLMIWFVLIFNVVIPSEGFIQITIPRTILIAQMIALLVLGSVLAVASIILSVKEIQNYYQTKGINPKSVTIPIVTVSRTLPTVDSHLVHANIGADALHVLLDEI